jgi:diguanylate cyclase (GGDEF)-like protein
MMNTNKLKFYLVLSRLPLLQKSYARKVMVIAFLGFLVPLFTLIVYLLVISSFHYGDNLNIFALILLATLTSLIVTLFLLYLLLHPITLVSTALEEYINNEEKLPQLPTEFADPVGKLMTNVQYTIEKLDLFNHSFKHSSAIDPLTGLPNHMAGMKHLRQDVARARREGKQMLVTLLNVDNLKEINDHLGHSVGDVCLTQTVEVLSKSIREGDWLARWDGDKFLMVLWNFNHTTPTLVLMRIRQQSVKMFPSGLPHIKLSIGACEYRGDPDLDLKTDLRTLLIRVDDALSQVKQAGRGGIVLGESQRSSFFI